MSRSAAKSKKDAKRFNLIISRNQAIDVSPRCPTMSPVAPFGQT